MAQKITLNELRRLVKQVLKEEISSDILYKNYNDYVEERLYSVLNDKEAVEWFTRTILWQYNINIRKFINPSNIKIIDQIGKSYYPFSEYYKIVDIENEHALNNDLSIYTDNKEEIINSVDIIVDYLKNFKINSTKQIDLMIDYRFDGPADYTYNVLIPSEKLKRYYLDKLFDKGVDFEKPEDSSFPVEMIKFLRPDQLEKIRKNSEFNRNGFYPDAFN